MPKVLKLTQLPQQDGVAEVQVRRSGIEARFDDERLAARQLGLQFSFRDDLNAASAQLLEWCFGGAWGGHGRTINRKRGKVNFDLAPPHL